MSDNEEEEYDYDSEFDGKKNAAVILIDVCSTMFDDPRPFKRCLAAVFQIMDRILLRGYRKNISVCFLKDEDIVLIDFKDNFVDSAKKIQGMLKQPIGELKQTFERQTPVSLRNTLSECMRLFTNLQKVNPYIVILTDDDDPHRGDQNQKLAAINVALSLKELTAKLIVLPLRDGFDEAKFYKELMQSVNDVPLDLFDDVLPVTYSDVKDITDILESVIQHQVNLRRHVFRLFDTPDKTVSFWVQLRSFVNDRHLYRNIKVSRVTNNKVKSEPKKELNINPDKMAYMRMGCEFVVLEKKTSLTTTMPYGFQLLSVTDRKQFSIHYMYKRGFLLEKDELQPADDRNQEMFDHMWQFCKDKNRVLLCCFYQPGYKTAPEMVELSPEIYNGKPCFIGAKLLNEDQENPLGPSIKSEIMDESHQFDNYDEEFTVVSDMVDALKIRYNPHQWTCQKYNKKACRLKAQLLDTDVNEVTDCFPTGRQITDKLSFMSKDLRDIFGEAAPPVRKKPKKEKKV